MMTSDSEIKNEREKSVAISESELAYSITQ